MRSLKRRVKPLMRRLRARRGIALFISLFFVGAIGALALSAIYLTMNAQLLSKSYEKEDNLKYAAEAALAIGKAELNFNPAALPSTSYVSMMSNKLLVAGDGQTIPGVTVDLYVGQTGSRTGQFGRFASLLALAHDASGTGFARRLELTQESFAKYAYWTNSEGAGISFGGGDQLWGPVWSNDTMNILTSGATFHDEVGTAGIITGVANGTFVKGYSIKQKPISLPSLSTLSTLSALASAGGMNYTALSTGDQTTVRDRIEFIAANLNPGTGDSTGPNDGFYRIYQANAGQVNWLRANWAGSSTANRAIQYNCGDWHMVAGDTAPEFFPIAAHSLGSTTNTWFDTLTASGMAGGATAANIAAAHTEGNSSTSTIMQHPGARCYLGGDPHLAAVARAGLAAYTIAQQHIGGTNTTFTPIDNFGKWIANPSPANPVFIAKRPWDAQYLYSLYRGYNTSTKGVMYYKGTVGISGVLRGDITLYSPNTIVILDDLRYSSDPAKGVCLDILGIIAGANVVVADNSLNTPQNIASSGTTYRSLDDTPDLYIQSVIMALGNSFTVENYNGGPTAGDNCSPPGTNGRGCLYLTGGLIQQTRGAVGTSSGSGFVKRYSYDPCGVENPPPYFPTTGRFQDNRYYELDPVKLNIPNFFASLSPDK